VYLLDYKTRNSSLIDGEVGRGTVALQSHVKLNTFCSGIFWELYGEVDSVKKHNYKIWLNDHVY